MPRPPRRDRRPTPARRRSAGFLILFGWRPRVTNDGRPPVSMKCPVCRRECQMLSKRVRNWFTLYFIPVIPLGGGQTISQCSACGAQFGVDIEVMRRKAAMPDGNDWQRSITLFNAMRETPTDPVKLHDLLKSYADMGEHAEVISAARQFPAALDASGSCLKLVAEAYAAIGDNAAAIACLEKALKLDPADRDAAQTIDELRRPAK